MEPFERLFTTPCTSRPPPEEVEKKKKRNRRITRERIGTRRDGVGMERQTAGR